MFFFFLFYLILSVLVLLNSTSQLHWSWGTPPELHKELYRVCGLQFGGAHSEMRCTSLVVLPLHFQCGSTFYRNNIWRVWLEDYICESVNFSPGAPEVGRLGKPSCYQGNATCTVHLMSWSSRSLSVLKSVIYSFWGKTTLEEKEASHS